MYLLQICSPALWTVFSFSWYSFSEKKFLILIKFSLSIIFSWIVSLALYLKRHHHTQGHLGFFLLSSSSFIVFFNPFWVSFCKGSRSVISLHMMPIHSGQFLEETIFASFYCLCSFVKNQFDHIYRSPFLGPPLCSPNHVSILSPLLHCLHYCSFIVSLDVG